MTEPEQSNDRESHPANSSNTGDEPPPKAVMWLANSSERRNSPAELLLVQKHRDYLVGARIFCIMYYVLRISAGLGAALLPFVVSNNPSVATILSIIIVVATALDLVFNPKGRWELYSRASDLLTVAMLKRTGHYKRYKDAISILIQTESAKLEKLIAMDELLKDLAQPKQNN